MMFKPCRLKRLNVKLNVTLFCADFFEKISAITFQSGLTCDLHPKKKINPIDGTLLQGPQ